MAKTNYNFGEQKTEKIKGRELKVILSPKYEISKEAAVKLLESDAGKSLTTNDFWIQKNQSKTGDWLIYSALIITHDALMKINATLSEDKRFDQKFCSDPVPFKYGGKEGFYMTYRDERDGMFEIGEITTDSCKNDYPYAMLLKRTFDRVVKRKANLFGIYSDAEDFSQTDEDECPAGKRPNPKAATQSIPKEEDEDLNVDPVTGEIIEDKKSAAEPPKTQNPEPKGSEAPANTADVLPPDEMDEVNFALDHVLEGLTSREGKGYELRMLVESEKLTDEQKKQRLQLYSAKGTENDKQACSIILAGLEMGLITFENSKF